MHAVGCRCRSIQVDRRYLTISIIFNPVKATCAIRSALLPAKRGEKGRNGARKVANRCGSAGKRARERGSGSRRGNRPVLSPPYGDGHAQRPGAINTIGSTRLHQVNICRGRRHWLASPQTDDHSWRARWLVFRGRGRGGGGGGGVSGGRPSTVDRRSATATRDTYVHLPI